MLVRSDGLVGVLIPFGQVPLKHEATLSQKKSPAKPLWRAGPGQPIASNAGGRRNCELAVAWCSRVRTMTYQSCQESHQLE